MSFLPDRKGWRGVLGLFLIAWIVGFGFTLGAASGLRADGVLVGWIRAVDKLLGGD